MEILNKSLTCPILIDSIELESSYEKTIIEEIRRIGDKMNRSTNVKADMSSTLIFNDSNKFGLVFEKICESIYKNFPQNFIIPSLEKNDNLQIVDFWSNLYRKSDEAIYHHHAEADIAFCYYIQTDEHSSPIIFDQIKYEIKPKNNMLLAFPGYLGHRVPKQKQSDLERISLAGNLIITN